MNALSIHWQYKEDSETWNLGSRLPQTAPHCLTGHWMIPNGVSPLLFLQVPGVSVILQTASSSCYWKINTMFNSFPEGKSLAFLVNICHRDLTFLKYHYVSALPLLSNFASADVCAANLSKPVLSASYLQKKMQNSQCLLEWFLKNLMVH